jgi:hypothetical protein
MVLPVDKTTITDLMAAAVEVGMEIRAGNLRQVKGCPVVMKLGKSIG